MKYLILICSLSVTSLFSQDISYSMSNEIILRSTDEYQGLLRADSTGYTLHIYERSGKGLLDFPGRSLILEKYDKNFNQVFSYDYNKDNKEPLITTELVSLGENYIWIVMEKIRQFKYKYSMIPIDLNGKLGKKEFLFNNTVEGYGDLPITYTRISPDSSKMVFIATFDDDRKKESTEIFSTVIDMKGRIIWDKFSTLRGNQKQQDVIDYTLDNEGNVYFVSKVYKDKKAKEKVKSRGDKEIAGYEIKLYKENGVKGSKLIKNEIELKGAFVAEAKLKVNKDAELICTGFTSSLKKNNLNGIFYAKLNSELEIVNQYSRLFSKKELIRLSKQSADIDLKSKDRQGLDSEFELINLLHLDDGSSYLIAEQNYQRSYRDYNNNVGSFNRVNAGFNSNSTTTTLYSNDIIGIYISNTGEINELELISKKQSASIFQNGSFYNVSNERLREQDYFLSHANMKNYDDAIFFYNDHEDNFDPSNNKLKRVERTRDMRSVIAIHNGNEYELFFAFSENDKNLIMSPTRSKPISDNELFYTAAQATKGNNSIIRIGVITIK